jgi:hypothetical protein
MKIGFRTMRQPVWRHTQHLGLLATIACVVAAAVPVGTASAAKAKRMVVWDGVAEATGAGWVNPTTSSINPQSAVQQGGKPAIEFKFKDDAHWIGAGWNWVSFKTGAFGTDVGAMKRFTFWIRSKGKTGDLQINLLCNGPVLDTPEHHTEKVHVLKYCPKLLDGRWHEVAVPLADLTRPQGFDPRHVCELQMGFLRDKAVDGSFYFADIAFDDRD